MPILPKDACKEPYMKAIHSQAAAPEECLRNTRRMPSPAWRRKQLIALQATGKHPNMDEYKRSRTTHLKSSNTNMKSVITRRKPPPPQMQDALQLHMYVIQTLGCQLKAPPAHCVAM